MALATVILAAGKGKRMKSDLPKVLHPLNGRPMIHYVVDVAEQINSDKIIIIVGHKKEMVMEELKSRNVEFAIQEEQLGTGHAVMQTEPLLENFDGDVLVLSGDVPLLTANTISQLLTEHKTKNPYATLLTAEMDDPTGYGRIVRNNNGLVEKIVEEKDADESIKKIKEINVGIYLFKKQPLFETLPTVKNDNAQGEYYLPDVIKIYIDENKPVLPIITDNIDETRGINNVEQLKEAEQVLLSRKN
ncbi:MAG: sugar phosphate nucleotidyltransferase [Calditrichia bacterium]